MEKRAGIVDMEIYYPHLFVEQKDLEVVDNCLQKYVLGLGQNQMAICNINEDAISLGLTVIHRFFKRTGIPPSMIGKLEVGTESSADLSKSIKTNLMKYFNDRGIYSVDGVDNINACYGGTAALFNCLNWVESSYWDGRFALVVTTDIAIYRSDEPSARATGGAAAVCMLIGATAPLCIENTAHGIYCSNSYDFCKPLSLRYPSVNGRLSQWMYILSDLMCSIEYVKAQSKKNPTFNFFSNSHFFAFHCPYTKLVQKGFIYLSYLHDFPDSSKSTHEYDTKIEYMKGLLNDPAKNTERADFEKSQFAKISSYYDEHVSISLDFNKALGNSYCSSLYMCLSSVLANIKPEVTSPRIILYSYGSGCMSKMFSISYSQPIAESVSEIRKHLQLQKERLGERTRITVDQMTELLKHRTEVHEEQILNSSEQSFLDADCYFLKKINKDYSREYELKEK